MNHKDLVHQIANLNWAGASPDDIILLSLCTAKEFAESLRMGLSLYPEDQRLKEMAEGELQTDNMTLSDYRHRGDHWEFLDHFIIKFGIQPRNEKIKVAMTKYLESIGSMTPQDRAMTIFSREEELTQIFNELVNAHPWDSIDRGFYKYYLKQHILFDSGENGHAWLTKHFPLSEPVLIKFYLIRLKLYESLF